MSQLLQTSAPVSNPDTVMRMITTARPAFDQSQNPPWTPKLRLHTGDESLTSETEDDEFETAGGLTASVQPSESRETNHVRETFTPARQPLTPDLHLAPDTTPSSNEVQANDVGWIEFASEESNVTQSFALAGPPTPQVQQLVDHLHRQQKKLAQREADLQAEVYHWDKQVLASKASLKKRAAELEQHLTQVEQQQALLMKLQQNLIDSQTAIRATVERLIDHSDATELKSELLNLQSELGQRFDEILNRWERVSQWHQAKEKFCFETSHH